MQIKIEKIKMNKPISNWLICLKYDDFSLYCIFNKIRIE